MNWKPPAPIDASPENRTRVSGPGLRTLLIVARVARYCRDPNASGYAHIGGISDLSDAARADEPLTLETDVLLRISAVLGIYRSLPLLEGTDGEGLKWLRGINRYNAFNGKAPMELMLSGFEPELMDVRGYLLAKEYGGGTAPNEVDRNFKS
ncbi:hypothetical protein [Bosea sp. ASV33]|uniref:hypothetical protein n=1 Tax=Bosea sp. ASV33 TaxID=2795106 RepID=UPI0018EDEAD7|nr:hypothetical protein [Bosea sp. ASV33]